MNSASAATEIKLIHIAKQSLQMDEQTYRSLVAQYGAGKTSSKDLSAAQRRKLLDHMKACGFKLRSNSGKTGSEWRREPQMRKLRAMWYVMAEG
ncbi:MAG: regulatory protein GemA, partial [Burkholderiaceae bacterium]|nr:regulatory protein GemA [Burkholderiaceae bacterium]